MSTTKYFVEVLFTLVNLISISLSLIFIQKLKKIQVVGLFLAIFFFTATFFYLKFDRLPFFEIQKYDPYFTESFDNNVAGWENINDNNLLICSIENSKLHIFPRKEKHFEFIKNKIYNNFYLTVEFYREQGHYNDLTFGNGIIFRYKNDKDYYVFLFVGNGLFKLIKVQNGFPISGKWRYSSFLNQGYNKNIISILASGPDIAIYTNDRLIHFERDLNIPHLLGKIGFYITGGSNIFIDNLTIQPVDFGFVEKQNIPDIIDIEEKRDKMSPFITKLNK